MAKKVNDAIDVTFLTEDQIWGDNALQVMKDYGTKTGMSDLAIVLGGLMGGSNYKTSDDQLSGYLWSASSNGSGNVRSVDFLGDGDGHESSRRLGGARPALPSSVASSIRPFEMRPTREISGLQVVEYGEYPQTIAPEDISGALEQAFEAGQLQTTGKKYTFDGEKHDAYDKPFSAKEYVEYQHDNKQYIRVEAQPLDNDSKLSNGRLPKAGEACWIEVQPIEWLKDPSGVMVARQALFSGVQFDKEKKYDGDFAKTDMKQYLQNHFAKEMQVGKQLESPAQATASERKPTEEVKIEEISADEIEKRKQAGMAERMKLKGFERPDHMNDELSRGR